ncbi:LAMI_0E12662g1_1 [Lachancea mirantina]|uniref:LAMI_0E12662g1_1 n=1 Tax=Lachancea mirantina TaxID=1230905 RepID=A0A1G4JQ87_9SACH|nr:LAMI_0E12662g1_1 [Lachancea mirantina]
MGAHVPREEKYFNPYNGKRYTFATWLYDVAVFIFDIIFTIFFREVEVRGSHHMPPKGTPTILVCAPHANQFVDGSLVMRQVRKLKGNRSRQTCLVTAQASYDKKYIGIFSKCTGGIPVPRAQDNLKLVDPSIQIYVPDWSNPTIIKGRSTNASVEVNFKSRFVSKSLIGLPEYLGNAQIAEIRDEETLVLSKPFKDTDRTRQLLAEGTQFKYAPRIDNTVVFQNVFNHLHTGGCVGIFPEGGSHDRPSLLPIKAGVAIMALGAAAADRNITISVVPCGINYFHRNRFRSRAMLEFGEPILVGAEMGQKYADDPRATTSELLETITQALYAVTVNAPDYETLMTIQAARRLYVPLAKTRHGHLPLPLVVEMNRRLLIGYSRYKDDPRIMHLKKAVLRYNSKLYSLGLKDHQVMKLTPKGGKWNSMVTLLPRLIQVYIFGVLSLPGTILFMPVFVTCHYYAKKKAEEGLKKSLVKLKGVDLLATWKLLVALVFAPTLYVLYSGILSWLYLLHPDWFSFMWIPRVMCFKQVTLFIYFYVLLVLATYASFRTGEKGMDLFKSLPPLVVSLVYPERKLAELQKTREKLSAEVTQVCNDLGPSVFPDFGKFANFQKKVVKEEASDDEIFSTRSRSSSVHSMASNLSNALSKVNSRGSLSDVPILGEGRVTDDQENEDQQFEVENTKGSSSIANMVRLRRNNTKDE